MKLVYLMLMVVCSFFMTVFYTTPIVQSMWNMLVFPYYKIPLESGVVYFVIIVTGLLKMSLANTEEETKTVVTRMVGFYITVGLTWLLSKGYVYFM